MIQNLSIEEILTLILIIVIIFPRIFSEKGKGFGHFFSTIIKGVFKMLGFIVRVAIKILEELFKLIALLISQGFRLLVSIFSWLKSLF